MTETTTVKSPRNAAYAAAEKALREAHPEEFQKFYEAACVERGIEYKPRLTPEERALKEAAEKEEKAKAKIDALRAAYPHLFS